MAGVLDFAWNHAQPLVGTEEPAANALVTL